MQMYKRTHSNTLNTLKPNEGDLQGKGGAELEHTLHFKNKIQYKLKEQENTNSIP